MTRRGVAARAAVLLAALAVGGCKTTPPTIGDPAPKLADDAAEKSYRDLLKQYSSTGEIYSTFDTHLFAGATFLSWPIREARVQRLAKFTGMTQPEIDAKLQEERDEHAKFHVFELGTWSQEPKFDDFDRKNSIWRLALASGGTETLPSEVERAGRVDQNVRALYPYMGQFWVRYRVKFPKTAVPEGANEVALLIASTLGKTELKARAE